MSEIRLQPWETRIEELTCQQYGLSSETLVKAAHAAGKGVQAAYKTAGRFKKAGRAHVIRVDFGSSGPWRHSSDFDEPDTVPHGPLWIYPTREIAWAYLEFDPGEWTPKPSTAAHLTAVSELRLALTGLDTNPQVWTSERLLRRQIKTVPGQPTDRIHDAWFRDFTDPDKVWAIEVELSRKFGDGRLLKVMTSALETAERHDLAGVLYFVRGEGLRRAVEGTAARLANKRGVDSLSNLEIHDLDATLARKG